MNEQRHHVDGIDAGQLALMKNLAEAASQETAKSMLLIVGIDVSKPLEAQTIMARLRKIADRMDDPDAVADAGWVRRWRPRTEGMFGKVAAAVITLCVMGGGTTLIAGAKALLTKP